MQRLREGGPPAVLGLLLGAVVGQAAVAPRPYDQLAAYDIGAQVVTAGLLCRCPAVPRRTGALSLGQASQYALPTRPLVIASRRTALI